MHTSSAIWVSLRSSIHDNASYCLFTTETHLKAHIRKLNPEKFICDVCGLEFDKRCQIKRHWKAEHTVHERIHKCTQCEKGKKTQLCPSKASSFHSTAFFTLRSLRSHEKYHGAWDRPCEFCGKLFNSMNNLRKHLYYHAPPKFICDFPNCDKKFYVKKLLRGHLKVSGLASNREPEIKTEFLLQSHLGQKDFVCGICKRGYYSQVSHAFLNIRQQRIILDLFP